MSSDRMSDRQEQPSRPRSTPGRASQDFLGMMKSDKGPDKISDDKMRAMAPSDKVKKQAFTIHRSRDARRAIRRFDPSGPLRRTCGRDAHPTISPPHGPRF